MMADLNVGVEGYIQNWIHPQNGQTYQVFALPKDLTITLVSGYNVQMRYAITKRWMELEQQVATTPALPNNYLAALKELVQAEEDKEALRLQNEQSISI